MQSIAVWRKLSDMRRFTLRLTVAVLTLVAGIAAGSLRSMLHPSSTVTVKRAEEHAPAEAPARPEREYTMVAAGRGEPRGGVSTAVSTLYTSDGMIFSRWSEYHDSPRTANREMRKTLKGAVKLIKRELLLDEAGLEVGEKVVAVFPPRYGYGAATFLWVKGTTFCRVESSSVENIFEYEKDFNVRLRR
jgi:hypothetical protein